MSSSTSSITSSPTSSSDSSTSPAIGSQAALYLYTFLVTLVLLLVISSAIVLRTFILRRRHRRMIEEGIQNGTYVPPVRTTRSLGRKPFLHDAFVDCSNGKGMSADCRDPHSLTTMMEGAEWWRAVMPLSVSEARINNEDKRTDSPKPTVPQPQTRTNPIQWLASHLHCRLYTGEQGERSSSLPPSGLVALSTAYPTAMPEAVAHVAVLICMPLQPEYKARLRRQKEAGLTSGAALDVEVPPVEFGLAEVPFIVGQTSDEQILLAPALVNLSYRNAA